MRLCAFWNEASSLAQEWTFRFVVSRLRSTSRRVVCTPTPSSLGARCGHPEVSSDEDGLLTRSLAVFFFAFWGELGLVGPPLLLQSMCVRLATLHWRRWPARAALGFARLGVKAYVASRVASGVGGDLAGACWGLALVSVPARVRES